MNRRCPSSPLTRATVVAVAALCAVALPVEAYNYLGSNVYGGEQFGLDGTMCVSTFEAATNFTATKMKINITDPGSGTGHIKMAIYEFDEIAGDPTTLLGETQEITITSAGWKTANLTSSVSISAGMVYSLVFITDDYDMYIGVDDLVDGNITATIAYTDVWPDIWEDPFGDQEVWGWVAQILATDSTGTAPTTRKFYWNPQVDNGDFSDPGNWTYGIDGDGGSPAALATNDSLYFNGTGGSAGEWCEMTAARTCALIDLNGYLGQFDFVSSTLSVTGYVRLAGTVVAGTGTLALTATSGSHTFVTGGKTVRNLTVSGGGSWTTSGNVYVSNNLTVSAGSLTLGSATNNITGKVTLSGGTLNPGTNALSVGKCLEVAGGTLSAASASGISVGDTVKISAGTLIAPSTGSFDVDQSWIKTGGTFTHSSGTVNLLGIGGGAEILRSGGTGAGSDFYNLSLGNNDANVTLSGTNLTVANNLNLVSYAALTVPTSLTLTVSGDLIIGASGTLDASAGSLAVGDSVEINTGYLTAPAGGTFTVGGGWRNNAGYFTHSSGTVTFNGTASGHQIVSGGTTAGRFDFYNLAIAGSGSWTVSTHDLKASSNITVSAGTLTVPASRILTAIKNLSVAGGTVNASAGGLNIDDSLKLTSGTLVAPSTGVFGVTGNWHRTGGTFTHSSGTVLLDGTAQYVNGDNTFYNLTKTVTAAQTLTFQAGKTQTVSGRLTLTGAAANLLSLRSSASPTQWNVNPAAWTISYVDVKDGVNLASSIINPANSVNSGNTVNWFTPTPRKVYWNPVAGNTNFSAVGNWSTDQAGTTPAAYRLKGDSLYLTGTGARADSACVMTRNDTCAAIYLYEGTQGFNGAFRFGSYTLSVNSDVKLTYVDDMAFDAGTGTLVLIGTGAGSLDLGSNALYNLRVSGSGTWGVIDNSVTVSNDLTVAAGTLGSGANTFAVKNLKILGGAMDFGDAMGMTVTDSVLMTSGTLSLPDNGTAMTVGGSWIVTGGTFGNGGSTAKVIFSNAAAVTGYINNAGTGNFPQFSVNSTNAGAAWVALSGIAADFAVTLTKGTLDISTNAKKLSAATTLTINGGTLSASAGTVKVGTNFTLSSGTFIAPNSVRDTIGGNWTQTGGTFTPGAAGTVVFTAASGTKTINGVSAFHNALFNGAGGWSVSTNDLSVDAGLTLQSGTLTVPVSRVLTVREILTVAGGTLNASAGALNCDDSVKITGGTLIAPSTGVFTVSGSWVKTGGTFTHSSGTVTFDATGVGETVTTGGSPFANVTFSGSGGGWTLGAGAFRALGALTLSAGTLSLGTSSPDTVAGAIINGGTLNLASRTLAVTDSLKAGAAVYPPGQYTSGITGVSGWGAILFLGGDGMVRITDRNGFVNTATAPLYLLSAYTGSMRLALNDTALAGAWQAYKSDTTLNISTGGGGRKTVWAQFAQGTNGSSPHSWVFDTTIYDATPPTSRIDTPSTTTPYSVSTWPGMVRGIAADNISGVDSVRVQIRNPSNLYLDSAGQWTATQSWLPCAGTTQWEFWLSTDYLTVEGLYTVSSRAVDKAGNTQTPSTSRTFTYDNSQPPTVQVFPLDTALLEGDTVVLRATVTGTSPSYAWYRQGSSTVLSTTTTLLLSGLSMADSGARFLCVVTNAKGADSSDMALVRVVRTVDARFGLDRTEGKDSAVVTFTDSSTGSILRREWYFGDGSVLLDSSGRRSVTHTYRGIGEYVCRLVVVGVGPAGVDSASSPDIIVYQDVGNPLRMTARYLSSSRIEVTIRGISAVNRSPLTTPYAGEIGLWLARNGPIDTAFGSLGWSWQIASIGSDSMTVVLSVPPPASAQDTAYRFWACPVWNSGPSVYSAINGARVEMRPVNVFTLAGRYLGNTADLPDVNLDTAALDQAVVNVSNAAGVDTPSVSRVVLWWGFDPTAMAGQDTVDADAFTSGIGAGGIYPWTVSNALFAGDTQRVYARVYQVSVNGLTSPSVATSFLVGWPKPANPCTLHVDSASVSTAYLRWSQPGAIDSLRLLYTMAPDSVRLGPVSAADLARYQTVYPAAGSVACTLAGLESNTEYQIGLQVKKNRQWTDVTVASRAIALTEKVDSSLIVTNTVRIDSVWFDAATNRIGVAWSVDTIDTVDLEVGVVCQADSEAAVTLDQGRLRNGRVVAVDSARDTALVDLGSALRFETKYYVALWLRNAKGPWASPGDSGIDTVRTPAYSWQVVRYFETDSVTVFNSRILLWRDPAYSAGIVVDTARVYRPSALPPGLVPAGMGFSLGRDAPGVINVGIRFDSIPFGYTSRTLGVYRDSAGVFLAVYGWAVDFPRRTVYVPTSAFVTSGGERMPLVVLADTSRPRISIAAGDTSDVARAGVALNDTAGIVDNIGNVRWKLVYAQNDGPWSDGIASAGYACGSCLYGARVVTEIPGASVTEDVGVRALLIVSDGVYTDTVNISRRAYRSRSDTVTTPDMQWTPLYATANLDSVAVAGALDGMAGRGGSWTYDTTEFRLFQWTPYDGNIGQVVKWVQYGPAVEDLFRFLPGRVIWIKTRGEHSLNLGSGVTVSLKAPYDVEVPSREWTDLALPWRFGVRMGDIVETSKLSETVMDSVEIYEWVRTDWRNSQGTWRTGVFQTHLAYSTLMDDTGLSSKARTLRCDSAYAVYNLTSGTERLRIPPVPWTVSRHTSAMAKPRGVGGSWSVKLTAELDDGMPLSPVYCGFREGAPGVRNVPVGPSFAPFSVGVYDPSGARTYGLSLVTGVAGEGRAWELAFNNNSGDRRAFRYRMERSTSLPQGHEVRVLDPAARQWRPADQWQTVNVTEGGRESRHLAVGSQAFFDSYLESLTHLRLALVGCYPNPFRDRLRVNLILPGLTSLREVRFRMFDMQGRLAWSSTVRRRLYPGPNAVVLGDLPPAGAYILDMTVIDGKGGLVGSLRTKVLSLR